MHSRTLRILLIVLILASLYPVYRGLSATMYARFSPSSSSATTLDDGLIGHWSFDGDKVTDKIYDTSEQGNNGYFVGGATTSAKVVGKVGQALKLDGTNDYVEIGNIGDYDGLSQMTVSAWVKLDAFNQFSSVIHREALGSYSSRWGFSESGPGAGGNQAIAAIIANGSNSYGYTGSILSLGDWHHWLYVFDGTQTGNSDRLKIYYDGIPQTLTFANTIPSTLHSGTGNVRFGPYSENNYLNGSIDDLRIYNRALSANEIEQLYLEGAGSKQNVNTATSTLSSGLVGYWSFNGTDVTDKVYDRSGSAKHGYIVNSATSSLKINGKKGQALTFDGTNDRIDIPTGQITAPYTISAWVKPANDTTQGYIFTEHTVGNANTARVFWLKGATLQGAWGLTGQAYSINGVYQQSSGGSIRAGEWQHLVATYDGGLNPSSIHLYRNAVETGYSLSATSSGSETTGGGMGSIGGRIYDDTRNLNGAIDDLRIYNRVLSANEIEQLYLEGAGSKQNVNTATSTLSSGLVGYWSFNGTDVTDKVYDTSGQGSHGYFSGGATSTAKRTGQVGQALDFDGVNDHVYIPDSSNFSFTNGSGTDRPFSVSAWVNLESATNFIIASKLSHSSGNTEWALVTNASNAASLYIYSGGSSAVSIFRQSSLSLAPDVGKWIHITGTYDGSESGNGMKLYRNGVPLAVSTTNNGSYIGMSNTASPVTVGVAFLNDVTWRIYSNGSVDEVRIYNRALSAQEVQALYSAGR